MKWAENKKKGRKEGRRKTNMRQYLSDILCNMLPTNLNKWGFKSRSLLLKLKIHISVFRNTKIANLGAWDHIQVSMLGSIPISIFLKKRENILSKCQIHKFTDVDQRAQSWYGKHFGYDYCMVPILFPPGRNKLTTKLRWRMSAFEKTVLGGNHAGTCYKCFTSSIKNLRNDCRKANQR